MAKPLPHTSQRGGVRYRRPPMAVGRTEGELQLPPALARRRPLAGRRARARADGTIPHHRQQTIRRRMRRSRRPAGQRGRQARATTEAQAERSGGRSVGQRERGRARAGRRAPEGRAGATPSMRAKGREAVPGGAGQGAAHDAKGAARRASGEQRHVAQVCSKQISKRKRRWVGEKRCAAAAFPFRHFHAGQLKGGRGAAPNGHRPARRGAGRRRVQSARPHATHAAEAERSVHPPQPAELPTAGLFPPK